ncbi:DUF2786 domain-containing protein [Citrobacter amalonaticus]|uniref:DUF2786 domain-containing protein n=1 Tax=Citrobacter amalonaticus TaxID=35703 RepID=UPI00339D0010
MTDKAKQIEKIRKLLALAAQSSNDGESANAFSRARRYMAIYGLTMEDIYGSSGASADSSAESERYRRDAETARQEAANERRARQEAEQRHREYQTEQHRRAAEEKKRYDEAYFRQQAEQKAQEQKRQADEHARQGAAAQQAKTTAARPDKQSLYDKLKAEKFGFGILAVVAVLVIFGLNHSSPTPADTALANRPTTPAVVTPPPVSPPAGLPVLPQAESVQKPVSVTPVAPPRPSAVNIIEYSAKSRAVYSCLADGTEKYNGGGNVSYKMQTFFFVSPSEIAFGKNKSGIRVVTAEGNGMYKLENGDEVAVDVFGAIERYWNPKMTFTCFTSEKALGQYLQGRTPR